MGYHRAGFEVTGVDIEDQRNYPFNFWQDDAITLLEDYAYLRQTGGEIGFAAVHASPPCQAHSHAQRIRNLDHPDFIPETRRLLNIIGLPYVIENVVGAPIRPDVELCGTMFNLGTYRHRIFEISGFTVPPAVHMPHIAPNNKMGRPVKPGEMMHVVGNFSGVAKAKEAMGIDWMGRNEMSEAIPPAYTEYIGKELLCAINY
jgi:DNA (cytosine-5)-methyltransferase 1